jgi:hypothetical protein
MSVKKSSWNNIVITAKRAIFVSFGVILVIIILNVNILFTFGVNIIVNGTNKAQCFASDIDPESSWMNTWSIVLLLLLLLII